MGSGEAPASQPPRAVGTYQLRSPKICLRLVEYQDHGWLFLASGHPADWSIGREGASVLHPGASDGRNASHRTIWIKSARTPRNCAHHAVDAMDSSRPRIETSQPSSPAVTPGGIHVVIQSVALQGAVDLHPSCTPRYAPGQGMHLVKVCTWSRYAPGQGMHLVKVCNQSRNPIDFAARSRTGQACPQGDGQTNRVRRVSDEDGCFHWVALETAPRGRTPPPMGGCVSSLPQCGLDTDRVTHCERPSADLVW